MDPDKYRGIEKAICLQVLNQIAPNENLEFVSDYNSDVDSLLAIILCALGSDSGCVVLGVDEVNKIWEAKPEALKVLIFHLGSYSCTPPTFFVPILAGTVFVPIERLITKSTHPLCHIPLPLLTHDSSVSIVRAALASRNLLEKSNDVEFERVVSDIGGHCRSLEFLYDSITTTANTLSFWMACYEDVRSQIKRKYYLDEPVFATAIANSFLSKPVSRTAPVPSNTPSDDLEA
jgi:hypothetical protein